MTSVVEVVDFGAWIIDVVVDNCVVADGFELASVLDVAGAMPP